MCRVMRSIAALSMTGPTQPDSCPFFKFLAFSQTFSTSLVCSPTVSKIAAAMHRWPAQPLKETTMSEEAISMSQSGEATRWFLAPPKHSAFLPAAVARVCTSSATAEDPTKVSAAMSLWSHKASTTSRAPFTIWNAPFGTPASYMRSATRRMVKGTFSLGFRMTQLPATSAMGAVHMGTIKGKLKGTMLVTMPTGSRKSWQYTPPDTGKILPWASCGIENAHSTVSKPLARSPCASVRFLPFSLQIRPTNSSAFCSHKWWNLIMMVARRFMVRLDHSPYAALAAATATFTSAAVPISTRAMTLPSCGLSMSRGLGRFTPAASFSRQAPVPVMSGTDMAARAHETRKL
mmetsp:Transcript_147910/g.474889  ORF Transcript_147910/g.474889 Transcript_147910/m.474889 type:complete len:347 (-) Transcript_147910:49-1089(-)